MGVEVDWRDVKGIVPSSATIGMSTGALVKFVSDIGTEDQAFLKPANGLFPSTGEITKGIYNQLQEFDRKTHSGISFCLLSRMTPVNRRLSAQMGRNFRAH